MTRRNIDSAPDFSPSDAFFNEILATRGRLPLPVREVVHHDGAVRVPIHVYEAHPEFVHAVDADDVLALLARVPGEFLVDLPRIVLLAGTNRQALARFDDGVFGHYDGSGIFLHAYPRRHLEVQWRWPVQGDELREFLRWGAQHEVSAFGATLRFDAASLRSFYLYDVLLHELGHHVDRRRQHDDLAERFAHWFADVHALALGAPFAEGDEMAGDPGPPPPSWRQGGPRRRR